jgi:Methyltransferase domain
MNPELYRHQHEMPGSHRAAERIVPVILAATGPLRSVVDVGGGDGGWLRVFQQHGVEEVLLLDRPEVGPNLVIDKTRFQPVDLTRDLPAPRRFDLALCLECAEHLPAHRALPLIQWLTVSADLVVFSAAIPGQGGKGHINERTPDNWNELFQRQGFGRHDVLRSKIVHDPTIPWWYRQNLFLFAEPTINLAKNEGDFLPEEFFLMHRDVADKLRAPGLRILLRSLGPALISAIRRLTGRRRVRNGAVEPGAAADGGA